MHQKQFLASVLLGFVLMTGCTSTEITESPKTGYAVEVGEAKDPKVLWTSRGLTQSFDYLGQIKVRAWSYEGALEKLKDAGREMRADAVIDISYDRVGFFKTMHAFAIKYK